MGRHPNFDTIHRFVMHTLAASLVPYQPCALKHGSKQPDTLTGGIESFTLHGVPQPQPRAAVAHGQVQWADSEPSLTERTFS